MNSIANEKLHNPLTLAFIGDGVYELLVRERIIKEHGSLSAGRLHRLAVGYVCANAQSAVYDRILGELSEEELAVLKRGRNANTTKCPKNVQVIDYRKATGIEALFGYLHLKGELDRVRALFEFVTEVHDGQERMEGMASGLRV